MSRPSVLVISHMFPRSATDWGGIFVLEQVKALRALGLDVRVCVGSPAWISFRQRPLEAAKALLSLFAATIGLPVWSRSVPWRYVQGVPVFYFDYLAPPTPLWGEKAPKRYRLALRRWFGLIRREFRVDVLHAFTALFDGSAAVLLGRASVLPVVLMEHTGPFTAVTTDPAMREQTQAAVNGATVVLTVSDYMRREMLRLISVENPAKMTVMSYGVDPDMFKPPLKARPSDGTIRALWVGGFLPVKQPVMLVQAFARAHVVEPRLTLTLVGYGVLERDVRDEVQTLGLASVVTFLPSCSRAEVAALMQRHDFLVVSSETDTFGLVVIEALACGRPVLTVRCGGPEGTIRDASLGEVVENNAVALAEGFLRISGRLGGFDPLVLAEYARREFSCAAVARRVCAIYDSVAPSRREKVSQ